MSKGKNFIEVSKKVDKSVSYSVDEAVKLLVETHFAKFDASVDVAVKLGIDPRQANQQIRSALIMPHGIGKDLKVLVFAKGEKVAEAKAAGADFVGLGELLEKITKENWLGFD
ncbi:MAG: 50S ribosomal protein L1, partial [Thermodesulfobacteriota bacterium]